MAQNKENNSKAAPATHISTVPQSAPATHISPAQTGGDKSDNNGNALFPRTNILMMAGCLILIITGFILMSGGSSSIEEGFNPDIFSTRRIVIGPAVAFLGFLLMAFAIIWNPRRKKR